MSVDIKERTTRNQSCRLQCFRMQSTFCSNLIVSFKQLMKECFKLFEIRNMERYPLYLKRHSALRHRENSCFIYQTCYLKNYMNCPMQALA